MWILKWFFKLEVVKKNFSQNSHWCALLLVCMSFSCCVSSLRRLNNLPHRLQLNLPSGGSEWQFLVWVVKFSFRLNELSHIIHLKGCSPVWILMWFSNLKVLLKRFPQYSHLYCLLLKWSFVSMTLSFHCKNYTNLLYPYTAEYTWLKFVGNCKMHKTNAKYFDEFHKNARALFAIVTTNIPSTEHFHGKIRIGRK